MKSYIRYILAFLFCQDGSWMCCSETHFGELLVLGCQIGIGDQSAAALLYQTLVCVCVVKFLMVSDLIPWWQKSAIVFL